MLVVLALLIGREVTWLSWLKLFFTGMLLESTKAKELWWSMIKSTAKVLCKSCLITEIKSKNKSENQASLVLASWKFPYKHQVTKEEFKGLLFSIRIESPCLNFQVARVHGKRGNIFILEVCLLGNTWNVYWEICLHLLLCLKFSLTANI